jgi:AraC-like DNA-binding protein
MCASVSKPTIPISKVRLLILDLLADGHPTLEMVAQELEVSPRTLQRRLKENDLTHSQLVHQLRFSRACQLLSQHQMRIKQIARETGFATPSAFSRAFHSWTGQSPRAFRNGL